LQLPAILKWHQVKQAWEDVLSPTAGLTDSEGKMLFDARDTTDGHPFM